MNRVPVITWNPAYIEELEPDGEVVPVDPAPFISGNTPIITALASEDEDIAEEVVEDKDEDHDDEDLSQTMREMYDILGELSEKIQTFNTTMRRSASPGQPPVVPDDTEVTQELQGLNQEISKWVSSPPKDTAPPIITVPASEDEDVTEDAPEDAEEDATQVLRDAVQSLSRLNDGLRSVLSLSRDTSSQQHTDVPKVDIWDTGKTIEQEFRLFPNPTRKGLKDRIDNQVWNLLRIMQERVDHGTYNNTDIRLVEGLHVISVLHARLGVLTEIALKHRAKRP